MISRETLGWGMDAVKAMVEEEDEFERGHFVDV